MDPAAATFNVPWLSFGLAILANLVIGFVWYAQWSPTGKIWIRETKMDTTRAIPGGEMARSMIIMIVGAVLMMFVFLHTNAVYQDAFSNTATGGTAGYKLTITDGLMGGFFTWLGFIVPLNLNRVAFERSSWSLYFVNSGYYLVALLVAGAIAGTIGV